MTDKEEKIAYFVTFLLAAIYFSWWVINFTVGHPGDRSHELYSDSYWIVALIGTVYGFFVSKQWGGAKSVFGRALLLFTLGLFAQVFGQVTYSYFALFRGIQASYPSIGDIGYFGSVVLYIVGVLILSKAVGARFKSASIYQKVVAVVAPLALLTLSYAIFLRGYQFTGHPVTTFLDFGYPLGQASYISLALLTYILSVKLLGGKMKNKVLLLLAALLIQYIADFSFLYRDSHNQWYAGDASDLAYQIAYLFMTIALLRIGGVARKLKVGSD
jgi:hypothetical protein